MIQAVPGFPPSFRFTPSASWKFPPAALPWVRLGRGGRLQGEPGFAAPNACLGHRGRSPAPTGTRMGRLHPGPLSPGSGPAQAVPLQGAVLEAPTAMTIICILFMGLSTVSPLRAHFLQAPRKRRERGWDRTGVRTSLCPDSCSLTPLLPSRNFPGLVARGRSEQGSHSLPLVLVTAKFQIISQARWGCCLHL